MKKATGMMMMVMAMVMMMGMMTSAQQQDCVSKLVGCSEYLNGTKPSKDCCDSIKEAVTKQLGCLCNLYNTPGLLAGFGVSVPQALNLTTNCGVPIKLDQCNSTTPAESPNSHSPPGGVAGGNNSSEKTAIAGILTVLLFFVSTLFY